VSESPARIGLPRVVSGVLSRPELLGRLDARGQLTVVRGIAGSGKSTLVASWLAGASLQEDVLWSSRTADIVSRADYWADVLHELGRFEFTAEWTGGRIDGPDAAQALGRAFAAIDRPLTIVLDNFGPPGDAWDVISEDVLTILGTAPQLRVIVIGREPTRLETAAATTEVLGTDDLRFSADEARQLADLVGPGGLGPSDVDALLESSRGVVFPLRYALEASVRARRSDRPTGDWAARLTVEMLDRLQDPDVLNAAGALAQAPFVTTDLVCDLLGVSLSEADDLLLRLARPGIAALDTDGVLRFTESARVALRDAYRTANPGRAAAADVLIARWLRERGQGPAAVVHAIRGGDFDLASDLLVEHFVELGPEETDQVVGALDRLSDDDRAAHPGLTMLSSLLRAVTRPRAAATAGWFSAAVDESKARMRPGTPSRQRFVLAAGEAIAQRGLGRSAESLAAAQEVLRADREMSLGERASLGPARALFLGQAGLAAYYAGSGDLAYACFTAELAASTGSSYPRRRNVALGNLAMLSILGGRAIAAEALMAEIVDADWAKEARDRQPSSSYTIAAAYLALNRGDFAATGRILDDDGGWRSPLTDNWAIAAVARAISRMLSGATRSAEVELAAALDAHTSPADQVAARIAGVETMIELLQLVKGDVVLGPQRDIEVVGRGAVIMLSNRAMRAAVGGRFQAASELIARARRFGSSPLQVLYTAVTSILIARAAGSVAPELADDFGPNALRIAEVVSRHQIAWPLAILDHEIREAVLAVVSESAEADADAVRAAFDRIPPAGRITPQVVELHPREYEVLRGLVETGSRAELAARSFVSVNTIKTQLRSIYTKLGVGDRESALLRAAELGLLEPKPNV